MEGEEPGKGLRWEPAQHGQDEGPSCGTGGQARHLLQEGSLARGGTPSETPPPPLQRPSCFCTQKGPPRDSLHKVDTSAEGVYRPRQLARAHPVFPSWGTGLKPPGLGTWPRLCPRACDPDLGLLCPVIPRPQFADGQGAERRLCPAKGRRGGVYCNPSQCGLLALPEPSGTTPSLANALGSLGLSGGFFLGFQPHPYRVSGFR